MFSKSKAVTQDKIPTFHLSLSGDSAPFQNALSRIQEEAFLCTIPSLCCTPDAPCKGQAVCRNMGLCCKDLCDQEALREDNHWTVNKDYVTAKACFTLKEMCNL